jgi:hypothetical protein
MIRCFLPDWLRRWVGVLLGLGVFGAGELMGLGFGGLGLGWRSARSGNRPCGGGLDCFKDDEVLGRWGVWVIIGAIGDFGP